ncbi:MAG: flagellar M-ring protein FliF [Lysobacteraceae bacterium]|nr:MAG: flagellar M-ring protein FliF [Xanthomonadaceae bacterium]
MNPLTLFNTLQRPAKLGLLVGGAVIALLTALALWWAFAPREQLLFGGLKQSDAAEIVSALDEWKAPYRIVEEGSGILVPEDMVYALRMRLVSAGVPKGGHVGFELFDDSDFGVTEFAQRVNYQRALQGEIERTIAALPGVEDARVHLSIRRPGLFLGDQEASKASVALTMGAGQSLSRAQVRGIRGLVSAAVEGLSVARVTVLDSDGALLAGGVSGGQNESLHEDQESEIEARIQQRVIDLLGQVLEHGEFKVTVDAELNFDTVREISERPLGRESGGALVSRRRVLAQSEDEASSGTPPGEDIEYAHGTAREEVVRAPGGIERLSVAAILPPALDENEVDRIRNLIAVAAGIDETRGDRLEVSRLGRDEAVRAPMRASADSDGSRTDTIAGADPRDAGARFDARLAAMFLTAGLLGGALSAFLVARRRERLRPAEREAMLEKLRGWLADGSLP